MKNSTLTRFVKSTLSLIARRGRQLIATLLALPLVMAPAFAQWPEKPITIVVPTTAGGSPDVVSRLLAAQLGKQLNQSVIVENRAGASGAIGLTYVGRAKPDGYTIGYAPTTALAINQHLYGKLPYDVDKDFDYVAEFIRAYNFLMVPSTLPVKTVSELVAYLKTKSDGSFFASSGNGTTGHLSGEMLKQKTGVKMTHVPFQGSPAALNEAASGRVDVIFDNTTSSLPLVQSGKLRVLAVTSPERMLQFPDVPTMVESGIQGFEVVGWGGIIVPKNTPKDIVARLNHEINAALKQPLVQDGFKKIGATPVGGTAAEMRAHVTKDSAMWGDVIKRAGISLQ